jgi:hypothetical protein
VRCGCGELLAVDEARDREPAKKKERQKKKRKRGKRYVEVNE